MSKVKSPPCLENWVAMLEGLDYAGAYEYPLFTDAHIIGTVTEGYGPYQFLNTVPIPKRPGEIQPAIILRAEWHLSTEWDNKERLDSTDEGYYHGGDTTDEIAAIVSLALGIRCKAGGVTRRFEGKDPRGRPCAWESDRNPVFLRRARGSILPRVIGTHSLEDLKPIKLFPHISPVASISLIRAARLYQDGLWIAESETSLSWLMLVSAVETAAVYWRSSEEPPIERLIASKPDLFDILNDTEVPHLAEKVAEEIAPSLGATKKFIDFVLEFLPESPTARPPPSMQLSLGKRNIKESLSQVYSYRSRALHGGTPFPAPMCEPPFIHQDWDAPAEKPMGLASRSMGGTWVAEDTPMLLHTFEFICRGALQNWWKSLMKHKAH